MKEATVKLKEGKLPYRSEGSGEPLILLHSLGTSGESWSEVMEPLARKFSVYAVDMMGHGDSDKPGRNYEIPDYARNIVDFMDALKLEKARIIGNSVGAILSVEIAASYPHRVSRQVLVGCPARETPWERMEGLMLAALKYDMEGNPRPMTMEDLSLSYAHPTPRLLEQLNRLKARAGLWCKKTHIAIFLWDIVPRLPKISCPTLVLYGAKDELRQKEQVLLKGIKGARYTLIEDAGHVPQVDAPAAFLKAVMDFL